MTTRYVNKTEADLAFESNKKRLRLEGQLLLDQMMNEALTVMSDKFQDAYIRGEILRIEGNRDFLIECLAEASNKLLPQ